METVRQWQSGEPDLKALACSKLIYREYSNRSTRAVNSYKRPHAILNMPVLQLSCYKLFTFAGMVFRLPACLRPDKKRDVCKHIPKINDPQVQDRTFNDHILDKRRVYPCCAIIHLKETVPQQRLGQVLMLNGHSICTCRLILAQGFKSKHPCCVNT